MNSIHGIIVFWQSVLNLLGYRRYTRYVRHHKLLQSVVRYPSERIRRIGTLREIVSDPTTRRPDGENKAEIHYHSFFKHQISLSKSVNFRSRTRIVDSRCQLISGILTRVDHSKRIALALSSVGQWAHASWTAWKAIDVPMAFSLEMSARSTLA
jgi:hypothetical protein